MAAAMRLPTLRRSRCSNNLRIVPPIRAAAARSRSRASRSPTRKKGTSSAPLSFTVLDLHHRLAKAAPPRRACRPRARPRHLSNERVTASDAFEGNRDSGPGRGASCSTSQVVLRQTLHHRRNCFEIGRTVRQAVVVVPVLLVLLVHFVVRAPVLFPVVVGVDAALFVTVSPPELRCPADRRRTSRGHRSRPGRPVGQAISGGTRPRRRPGGGSRRASSSCFFAVRECSMSPASCRTLAVGQLEAGAGLSVSPQSSATASTRAHTTQQQQQQQQQQQRRCPGGEQNRLVRFAGGGGKKKQQQQR